MRALVPVPLPLVTPRANNSVAPQKGIVFGSLLVFALTASPAAAQFSPGRLYVSDFFDDAVVELDPSLNKTNEWIVGDRPAGMAFDPAGNLVVATQMSFEVYAAPGALMATHSKLSPRRTENIVFDDLGRVAGLR